MEASYCFLAGISTTDINRCFPVWSTGCTLLTAGGATYTDSKEKSPPRFVPRGRPPPTPKRSDWIILDSVFGLVSKIFSVSASALPPHYRLSEESRLSVVILKTTRLDPLCSGQRCKPLGPVQRADMSVE